MRTINKRIKSVFAAMRGANKRTLALITAMCLCVSTVTLLVANVESTLATPDDPTTFNVILYQMDLHVREDSQEFDWMWQSFVPTPAGRLYKSLKKTGFDAFLDDSFSFIVEGDWGVLFKNQKQYYYEALLALLQNAMTSPNVVGQVTPSENLVLTDYANHLRTDGIPVKNNNVRQITMTSEVFVSTVDFIAELLGKKFGGRHATELASLALDFGNLASSTVEALEMIETLYAVASISDALIDALKYFKTQCAEDNKDLRDATQDIVDALETPEKRMELAQSILNNMLVSKGVPAGISFGLDCVLGFVGAALGIGRAFGNFFPICLSTRKHSKNWAIPSVRWLKWRRPCAPPSYNSLHNIGITIGTKTLQRLTLLH